MDMEHFHILVRKNIMKTRLFSKVRHQLILTLSIIAILLSTTSAFAAAGFLDPSFGANGVAIADLGGDADSSSGIALQPDGKILLLGSAQGQAPVLMRYNSNGSSDNTFGVSGKLALSFGRKVAIQSDGKLIVAGSSNGGIAVARYNSNGTSLDNSFGTNGVTIISDSGGFSRYSVSDLALESNGRIVIVGTESNQGNFTNIVIARFNSNGTLYETDFSNGLLILDKINFPNNRYNNGDAVVVQADGKIVVSGRMMDDDANGQISLARLNPDSSLDTSTFGTNGKGTVTAAVPHFDYHESSLTLQPDGKLVVVGTSSDTNDLLNDLVVARFNNNGALDATFGGTGIVVTDFGANEFGVDVHLQSDGRIAVVGRSSTSGSDNLLIVRYNTNGSLDNTFGDNGKLIGGLGSGPSSGTGIEIQPDGRIVAAGSSNGNAFLARYLVGSPTTVTFRSVAAYDGWILESAENSNVGGSLDKLATTFNAGDDVRDRQYKSVLSFNTAALPDTAVVTSVQLNIMKQGLVGTDPFTTHGDLLLDIRSSAFNNNLALELADFSAAASPGSVQEKFSPLTSTWYTVNLNSANLGFISKIGVTQFRIFFSRDDNDDLGADYLKFFTGNSITANQPQLIVTYYMQ